MPPQMKNQPRINCPHERKDLTLFERRFSNISKGQDLSLLNGDRILFGSCSLNVDLGRLVVANGSVLVLNDQSFTLRVREIVVETGGELWAGSETCRLEGKIDVIFIGNKTNSSPFIDGAPSKGLMASGTVEIHAKQYHPTFTRLAASVSINDTVIVLQDEVNWEVGQKILLTTTAFYDCPKEFASWCAPCAMWEQDQKKASCKAPNYYPHQNEIRTIVAISNGTKYKNIAIQVDQPVLYSHFAGVEYAGEVALLSRRFRFIGEDSGTDYFGGHIMIHKTTGIGRFSGVQGENMGQLNVMGRYPFHFHLIGENGSKSFIQDCLVTNSNFRAYTIHGVNNTRLSRSVAYNVKGFAVYLEDAIEENNLIEYNLMAHIHPIFRPADGDGGQNGDQEIQRPELLVPADISASGYYITNAYNDIIGNVASGGWSGFAFPNAFKPLGLHKDLDLGNRNPANRPTKSFVGNTAHSTGFYWRAHGAGVYVGGNIYYDAESREMRYNSGRTTRKTILANGNDAKMVFNDTKVFAANKGVAHWGNRIEIYGLEVHDFGRAGAMLFGQCALVNGLINARTDNKEGWFWQKVLFGNEQMGFQFYDTWVQTILSRTTFRNFNESSQTAIRYMDHSDQFIPQGINSVKGLTFQNTPRKNILAIKNCGEIDCPGTTHETMSAKIYSLWDFDGSLALKPGIPHIFGSTRAWWKVGTDCVKDSDWKVWVCPWKKNHDISFVPLVVPGLSDGCDPNLASNCTSQYAPYTVGYVTRFGSTKNEGVTLGPWPGVAGHSSIGWYWRSQVLFGGVNIDGAPSSFSIGEYLQIRKGKFVVIGIAYPPRTTFEVKIVSKWWGQAVFPAIKMAASKNVVFTPSEDVVDHQAFNCTGAWYNFCSNTGGAGLGAWFFDGKHFYLRVVSPGCYNTNQKANCQNGFYTADGINVPSLQGGFIFSVTANCSGCNSTTYKNVKYYSVVDNVPPAFQYQLGTVRTGEGTSQTEKSVCDRKSVFSSLEASPNSQQEIQLNTKVNVMNERMIRSCVDDESSRHCFHPQKLCQKKEGKDVCFAWKEGVLQVEPCRMCE